MRIFLNDMLDAKGVSEPLREAVKALISRLEAWENVFGHLGTRGWRDLESEAFEKMDRVCRESHYDC